MLGIDETIGEVERLFRTVTGQDVPRTNGPYAPIPAEKDPLPYVQEQIERLTNVLGESAFQTGEAPPVVPPLTIWEMQDELIIAVQMPGVPKDGLHVEVQGRLLFITGHRRRVARENARLVVAEQSLGPYQRTIPLPEGAGAGDVTAHLTDGQLEIRIRNKTVAQETRDIPVR